MEIELVACKITIQPTGLVMFMEGKNKTKKTANLTVRI